MNMNLLKSLVKETLKSINESKTTTDVLNACFKNVQVRNRVGPYDVMAADFKSEVENQIKFMSSAGRLREEELEALENLLMQIPDSGKINPRELQFAIENLNSDVPDAPKPKPIDMNSLPLPSQVDVSGILQDLAVKHPMIFGPESGNDPNVISLVRNFNPDDKKYFSHGMQIGSDNVRGERKRIFPKDSQGQPLKRPDGSIIFFYAQPRTPISAIFDVYTYSFVHPSIFDERTKIYRQLWSRSLLPSPVMMARSRQVRAGKL